MRLLNEEVYILPYDKDHDKKLLYAPVRGAVLLIDQYTADIISKGSIATPQDLIVNTKASELIQILQEYPLKDLDVMQKGLPELNIDLSSGCNMRCIYCYAGRGDGTVKLQKKENIEIILDTYLHHLSISPIYKEGISCSIAFTNDAEPTFAPDLLKYSVLTAIEKAKLFKIKPVFSLPSNCAFQEELRPFIIKYFTHVSCSFEGLPWVQNLHRPLVNGKPSFDLVYDNIKVLYQSSIRLGFNIVVTRHNLHFLKETIDFFHENFPGVTVSFSRVILTGRALEEQKHLAIDDQSYDEALIHAVKYAKTTSIKVQMKHGPNKLMPRRHYCSSTARPNWSVSLTGAMYACMEEKSDAMKIGQFDFDQSKVNLDYTRIGELRSKNVDRDLKCRDCFAKYLCAGGCLSQKDKKGPLCEGITKRCLHLIHQAYENKIWAKAQKLFTMTHEN